MCLNRGIRIRRRQGCSRIGGRRVISNKGD